MKSKLLLSMRLSLVLLASAALGSPILHTDGISIAGDPGIGRPLGELGVWEVWLDDCLLNQWGTCDDDYNDAGWRVVFPAGEIQALGGLSHHPHNPLLTHLVGGQLSYLGHQTGGPWFWAACVSGCEPDLPQPVPEPGTAVYVVTMGLMLVCVWVFRRLA